MAAPSTLALHARDDRTRTGFEAAAERKGMNVVLLTDQAASLTAIVSPGVAIRARAAWSRTRSRSGHTSGWRARRRPGSSDSTPRSPDDRGSSSRSAKLVSCYPPPRRSSSSPPRSISPSRPAGTAGLYDCDPFAAFEAVLAANDPNAADGRWLWTPDPAIVALITARHPGERT